jgi:hypothetical protein
VTRLELVRALGRECGVSGVVASTESTPAGEDSRLIGWIDRAWEAIQTKQDDWQWMRSSNLVGLGVSFTTIAGDYDYPLGTGPGTVGVPADNFGKWDPFSFRCYTTAFGFNDEDPLGPIGYDAWRDGYMLGAQRTVQTRPTVVAIGPNDTVVVAPPPTDQYTITADYYIAPTIMTLDDDRPTGLPVQYHMLIVYLAMTYYAGYESAPEVLDRGQAGYSQMLRQLARSQAQGISIAEALA